jgi:hypothetical protein
MKNVPRGEGGYQKRAKKSVTYYLNDLEKVSLSSRLTPSKLTIRHKIFVNTNNRYVELKKMFEYLTSKLKKNLKASK